ncbi:MAG TPA: hypothetical protein VGQ57_10435, partial [Polyangiaceae bacterium]|nr:hypothetical protein [Polyangiaceae bacterium]
SNRNRRSSFAGLSALFLAATVIAQGCGSDDNPQPVTPVVTGGSNTGGTSSTGKGDKGGGGGTSNAGSDSLAGSDATGGTGDTGPGSGGTGNSGQGGKGSKGGKGGGHSTGGTGNTGNEAGTGDVGNDGGTGNEGGNGPVDCSPQGTNQCYPCKPHDENNVEFLNRCNDAKCSKFDNATRIEGFTTPLPPT